MQIVWTDAMCAFIWWVSKMKEPKNSVMDTSLTQNDEQECQPEHSEFGDEGGAYAHEVGVEELQNRGSE